MTLGGTRVYYPQRTSVTPIINFTLLGAGFGSVMGIAHYIMQGNSIRSNAGLGHMIRGSFLCGGLSFFYFSGRYIMSRIRQTDDVFNAIGGALAITPLCRQYMSIGLCHNACFGTFVLSVMIYMLVLDFPGEGIRRNVRMLKEGCLIDVPTLLRKPKGEPYVTYEPNSFF